MMALKETGDLDLQTMDMMEKPRCGVADMTPEGGISPASIRISVNGANIFKQPSNYYAEGWCTTSSVGLM